jgi:hypothetical protein
MKLFVDLAAEYRLDARNVNGQRLETDTLVDAEYVIEIGSLVVVRKRLDQGLTINHSDNQGDGFLFVKIENGELRYTGKARHKLIVEDCQGNRYGVNLRPEFIYIEE